MMNDDEMQDRLTTLLEAASNISDDALKIKKALTERHAPEPDYSKWIGKLCWFWHTNGSAEVALFREHRKKTSFPFVREGHGEGLAHSYMNCRPLTRAEALALVAGEDGDE